MGQTLHTVLDFFAHATPRSFCRLLQILVAIRRELDGSVDAPRRMLAGTPRRHAIISSSSASAPVELLGGAGLRQVDELDEPQAAFVAPRKPLFKAIQPATGTRTAEIMSASQE